MIAPKHSYTIIPVDKSCLASDYYSCTIHSCLRLPFTFLLSSMHKPSSTIYKLQYRDEASKSLLVWIWKKVDLEESGVFHSRYLPLDS